LRQVAGDAHADTPASVSSQWRKEDWTEEVNKPKQGRNNTSPKTGNKDGTKERNRSRAMGGLGFRV